MELGKCIQNGVIKRFNRIFVAFVLDEYWFEILEQLRIIAEGQGYDHNLYHPHIALELKVPCQSAGRYSKYLDS